MKKLGYIIAALGALAVAAPSIASAETVVIKRGGGYHQGYNAHAEMRHRGIMHRDRGMHRERHHHDRIVVIKRHRH